MMQLTRTLWLWLFILPWCSCPEPKKLFNIVEDLVYDEKICLINGRMSSLREIIHPSQLNFFDFYHEILPEFFVYDDNTAEQQHNRLIERNSIGPNIEIKLSGSKYIQRTYYNFVYRRTQCENIIDLILIKKRIDSIYFLVGNGVKDGKTVELAKIHEAFIKADPAIWTIPVDASNHFKKLHASDITEQFLFDTFVHKKFKYLFTRILKHSPARIVILFDNIDLMSLEKRNAVLSLIHTLVQKGICIIMTGQKYLLTQLGKITDVNINAFHMDYLTNRDRKDYLQDYWEKKMIPFKREYRPLLNEYLMAMFYERHDLDYFRTFLTLDILAEELTSKQAILYHQPKNRLFDVGCRDYVVDRRPLPYEISLVFKDMHINHMDFLTKIMDRIFQSTSDYDIMEMKNIIYDYCGKIAYKSEMNIAVEWSEIAHTSSRVQDIVKALGIFNSIRVFPSSNFYKNSPYIQYFAAHYVIKTLKVNPPFFCLYTNFKDLTAMQTYFSIMHKSVLQLIDCSADQLNVDNLLALVNPITILQTEILDQFIDCRSSNLFDLVAMRFINDPNTVKTFVNFLQSDEFFQFQALSVNGFTYEKSITVGSFNRIDRLIKKNMIQFSPWIEKFPFEYLTEDYRVLIFEALTQNVVTLEEVNVLKRILSGKFSNDMSGSMRTAMAKKMEYLNINVDVSVYREFENIASFLRGKISSLNIDNSVSDGSSSREESSVAKSSTKLEKIKKYKNTIASLKSVNDIQLFQRLVKTIDVSDHSMIGELLETYVQHLATKPMTSLVYSEREKFLKQATILAKKLKSAEPSKTFFDVIRCLLTRKTRTTSPNIPCYYGWSDVDSFNDAREIREIDSIRVNSDKFLKTLAIAEFQDYRKAVQLVDLIKYLEYHSDSSELLTGKSKMRLYDVLREKGLKAYRQIQRLPAMMKTVLQQTSGKKSLTLSIPIKATGIYAAAVIPFIKGLYATITTCLIQTNGTNENCLIASGAFAVSALTLAPGLLNPRYIHWTLAEGSAVALKMLPLNTPNYIRINIRHLQGITLESTAKALHRTGLVLTVASLGFDIYNIVDMALMIDMCTRSGSQCLSKDKIDYIISLTFSAVSIGVTAALIMTSASFGVGAIIGLSILLVNMIATGINEVIYYSNKYDTDFGENVDIFFHKIIGQSPSEDVVSYVKRTDWVHVLEKHVNDVLENNEHVVAYAVGIGKFPGNKVDPSIGNINMANSDRSYTSGLSRIIPAATNNTALLCLPREDKNSKYEKYPNTVPGAEYRCTNSFVIAEKHRWNKIFNDTLYIIYELGLIGEGNIVGSNTYNNRFLISNSSTALNIFGGFGNITNHFKVQSTAFRGHIFIRGKSLKNILDLSDVNSPIVHFTWSNRLRQGQGKSDENINNMFNVRLLINSISPNLQIIGRDGKLDVLSCDYHRLITNQTSIIVDSRGGQSITSMDYVTDCEISVIRPFTRIVGSNSTNIIYTAHVWLDHKNGLSAVTTIATIEPRQSTFMVAFVHRPFFSSIDRVTYTPVNKTLNFILQHTDSMTLSLSIVPYHSGMLILSEEIKRINCLFMDSYVNTTITPIIHEPIDGMNVTIIKHFDVLSTVSSSRLTDVIKRFHYVNSFYQAQEFYITTKLSDPTTNQTFTIGSAANNRFLIENTTTYLHGGDGVDVYVLNSESSNCTWIDNDANDDALDTLIVPDTTCTTLHAEAGSLTHEFTEASIYDVTLFCSIDGKSTPTRVILQQYLMESRQRHLQIHWHDTIYMLLPPHWITKDEDNAAAPRIELALVISFNSKFSEVTTVTLTTLDTFVLFNITDDENANPFVAFKSGSNDIIVTRKNFHQHSALMVVLQDFFTNDTDDIANDWLHTKFFTINSTIRYEDLLPKTLNANDIKKLYLDTLAVNNNNEDNENFIEEYLVNFADTSENHTIVIDHNNNVSMHDYYKLGVLAIIGAQPNEFEASLIDNNGTSLALCARQTCIHIKNWCKPIHRIQRIEFFLSLDHRPIIVNNIDHIKCDNFEKSHTKLSRKLNQKFIEAQRQILLTDDDDNSRLIKCVGSIFADIMTNSSMFEMFGFTSSLEHRQFMSDNCQKLFTLDNLKNLSLTKMNETLTQMIKVYFMKTGISSQDKEKSRFIQNVLAKLDSICWQRFTTLLVKFNNGIYLSNNGSSFVQLIDEASFILTNCLEN